MAVELVLTILKKRNNMWGNTAFANRKHRPHAPLFGVCYLISITPTGCSHTLKRVQGALLPAGGAGAKPPHYCWFGGKAPEIPHTLFSDSWY